MPLVQASQPGCCFFMIFTPYKDPDIVGSLILNPYKYYMYVNAQICFQNLDALCHYSVIMLLTSVVPIRYVIRLSVFSHCAN